jgi:4-hydroxy-tetrahydrodipicolinate synthase
MWKGVYPAVTSKFKEDGTLDHDEMSRCFGLMMDAGCDGLIVCGSLGEGSMLSPSERLEVLKIARSVSQGKPILMTIADPATRDSCEMARKAEAAKADGLMVIPNTIYPMDRRETIANLRTIASASGLPVMIYSNRLAYRVDVTPDIMAELADEMRFVALKESSDDIRRTTEMINACGDRFDVFTGVDNLALEALAMGAVGWVAGLVCAFPKETVAIYRLVSAGRFEEARAIYRWFRPLLDLDVSTYLVQNIKLAEAVAIGSNDRVRGPRLAHHGQRRTEIEALVRNCMETRPALPSFA